MSKKKKYKDSRPSAPVVPGDVVFSADPGIPSWKQDIFVPVTMAFCALVFFYACARAASLNIVHDEAVTYFIQRLNSFAGIMGYEHPLMANNHFLNTLLIKVFTGFFGSSEFVVRIPALLGCGLYLAGVTRIGRLFLKGPRLLMAVALLSLNPFMMDFFSCARGYSLGLGLLAMGLSFLAVRIREPDPRRDARNALWAASLSALSVFAHLTFVNVYFAVLCVLMAVEISDVFSSPAGGRTFVQGLGVFFKRAAVSIGPGVVFLFLALLRPALSLVRDSELNLLEGEGFWRGTVGSLIEATAYGKDYFSKDVVFGVLAGVLSLAALAGFILVVRWLKKKPLTALDRFLLCIEALMLVYVGVLGLQGLALKQEFPYGRWAIAFLPVFSLIVVLAGEEVCRSTKAFIRLPGTALLYLLSLVLCLHYILCFNVTHFHIWKYDATTREMLDTVATLEENNALEDDAVHLSDHWLFSPSVNYYLVIRKMWWLNRTQREGPDGISDYYYLPSGEEGALARGDLELIKKFDVSGAFLARPKEARPRVRGVARGRTDFADVMLQVDRDKEKAERFIKSFTMNDGATSFIRRGGLWAREKKWEHALSDFNRAVHADPDSLAALVLRARAYEALGDDAAAVRDREKARTLGVTEESSANLLERLGITW